MNYKEKNQMLKDLNLTASIEDKTFEEHLQDLVDIQNRVAEGLKSNPNFKGIAFQENPYAQVIHIQLSHKAIYMYYLTPTIELKSDMSNKEEAIQEVIEAFKQCDTEEYLTWFREFLADGEKYGWD